MIETVSEAANMNHAFAKGMRELAARDRREAARVREEICQVLGGIKRTQYFERQRGSIQMSPAERKAVEQIFRRRKVAQPWGL